MPQRAAHYPLLLYAILANSSFHRSKMAGIPDESSGEYQALCVKILLRSLGDPEYVPGEIFLAAIVILRSCEELSGKDGLIEFLVAL